MEKIYEIKLKESKRASKYRCMMREINRNGIFDMIRNYKGDELISIDGKPDLIEFLLFKVNEASGEKMLDIPDDIICRLDYSDICFDNMKVNDFDFTGMHGVYINPQTVFNKNMRNSILNGVTFTGPFDDVYIPGANFEWSVGALINPQEVYDKNLSRAVLADCVVVNDFEDTILKDTIIYDTTMIMSKEDYEKLKEMKKVLIKSLK